MSYPLLDLNKVETYSVMSLAIADISNYGNITINNPSMEITPPGYNKVNVPFTPQAINVYRSEDLGICGEGGGYPLPDGIYKVKYSIKPNDKYYIEKSFISVHNIVAKLQRAYLSLQLDCGCNNSITDKAKKELSQIQRLLIEGAVSAANLCDDELAYTLLLKANQRLDKVSCGC